MVVAFYGGFQHWDALNPSFPFPHQLEMMHPSIWMHWTNLDSSLSGKYASKLNSMPVLQETYPYISQAISLYMLLSLTIKLNVSTITVSLRQVLTPLPPPPYLKMHISKLVTVHISCAYSQHIVTYCAYRWVISPCFPAHSLKWKRAWKPILPLAHHCFSFSPRLLN